jgi:thiol-disulfide isomerase/thioredoxin
VLVLSAARAEDRNLKPSYDWVIEIDGVVDKGWKIYTGAQKTRMLLMSPPGDQALMVLVSERSVRPADTKLIRRHENMVDCLAGCLSATRILPLTLNGSAASFSHNGRAVTVKPRPALVGALSVADLLSDRPNISEAMDAYQPEGASVSFLRDYAKPTEVEIFFGTWCPVCEAWLPKLLKSMQAADNSKISMNLHGLPKDFSSEQELAKQKGIRGLPTFIIRQGGVEIGRIVGAPKDGATIEGSVVDVLRAKS